MNSYKVFTISSGAITDGAEIGTLHLKGAGIDIPAIIIGEEGRGRERGVIPVDRPPMVPCPNRNKNLWASEGKCDRCGTALGEKQGASMPQRHHPDAGLVQGRLVFAEVSQTKTGKPKLFSKSEATSDEFIIAVFRTKIGFRGGNAHTGDRIGWKCRGIVCDAHEEGVIEVPTTCPKCDYWETPEIKFAPFSGNILARGRVAQGDAGRMGSGEQLIALIPKDVVFRTSYSGRLYGNPGSHYYKWDGKKILAATWDERGTTDLF